MTAARHSLEPVIGVSWPRSGHHMLVRLLQLYFGPDFGYCDYYSGKPWVDDIDTCCGTIPCRYAGRISLTKNHDFDLAMPRLRGKRYLIQYRDFAPSVVSNFELFVRQGGEDSLLSFRRFASMEFSRYREFVRKWVTSDFARDQLVVNYSTVLQDPEAELARVVRFFAPGETPDQARLLSAISQVDGQKVEAQSVKNLPKAGVHRDRNLRQFRYYSPALFQEIAQLRLDRETVIQTFKLLLGRAPAEHNILGFQGYETPEALETFVRASPEYRHRNSRNQKAPPQ